MGTRRWPLTFACCSFLALSYALPLAADDTPPAPSKPAAPPKPAAGLPKGIDIQPVPSSDLYTLPTGDNVASFEKFLQRLLDFQPESRDELLLYRKKAPLAMRKAAERILALETDHSSRAWRLARRHQLSLRGRELTDNDAADGARHSLLTEIVQFISAGDKSADDQQLAIDYAVNLEFVPARDLAAEAYSKFGQLFVDSTDADIAKRGRMLLGAARRLKIVGQSINLKGTTLDGRPFDIASLRGKVVLIDFWATWCEPCLKEYPNIKTNYAAYKDRGFEVVGVSIDDDRPALEEFVAEKRIPWTTLHDKEHLGEHPATIDYGVFSIPSVILIDKEGKAVSTRARGEELGRLLKDLLGP